MQRHGILWLVLAVPPAAWAAHGLLGWYVAASACAPNGLSMDTARWLIGLLTLAALAATAFAFVIAARRLRAPADPGISPGQDQFAAYSLLLVSVPLALGVLLGGLPALFIRQCGFST
jgi:hypothetical protein